MPRELRALMAAGLLVAISACSFGTRTYFGQPLDPSAPNVVPGVGEDAATIENAAAPAGFLAPGSEGSVLFIRMADASGKVVLDRPFDLEGDQQRVPPGSYHLIAYWRVCDANCGNVDDGEAISCETDVTVSAGGRIRLELASGGPGPFPGCRAETV